MKHASLTGLTAAAHTPFHADGSLNLAVVELQAEHMLANGTVLAFETLRLWLEQGKVLTDG